MKMNNTIEWVGTGSGLNPSLGNTSFLVRGSSDRTLLVDCGSTVTLELIRQGRLREITDLILTHAHADHIGGIEGLAFMNFFTYQKRGENRPLLYLGSERFVSELWNNSLRGGLERLQAEQGEPINAVLDTYFRVRIGNKIEIPGLPSITLVPTNHVVRMESYGLRMGDVFYSGDTIDIPPSDSKLIFQDCQFFESKNDVHISYDRLKRELPPEVRAKTYLVHLSGGWDKKDPTGDGFAGFVRPGDKFEL